MKTTNQLQQELDPTTPAIAVEPKEKFPEMPEVFHSLLSYLETINVTLYKSLETIKKPSAEHDNEVEPKAA